MATKVKWYKSKTVKIAIIQAVAGILALILGNSQWDTVGIIALVKSALDIIVRYATTSPIE